MGLGSLKDLYLEELGDLYDAETQMIRALARFADAARAPELRELLTKHGDESRLHLERLQLIFTHWGERAAPRPCAGLAGIVQEADERLNQPATADARDAAIIGIAQRIEHYEIAAYGTARTYARRLNRADEARLLQETLEEEARADRRFREIAEAHLVDDARSETELYEARVGTRLQYVEARQLSDRRLAGGSVRLLNEADDDLGMFEGLIIDAASRRTRYIVVDARGMFSRRRYLLPIRAVRFDPVTTSLRIDLDRNVAERYPEFDPDEFQQMDEAALRGYEARLDQFFPRRGKPAQAAGPSDEGVPEWLMTAVWVTVPPERAERFSDPVRSFANEFAPNREQPARRERAVRHAAEPRREAAADRATPPHGDKLRG